MTDTKATPATDEEIARVGEMIHGTFPILWIKAETADGLLSRIAADTETIKAREAAYDQAQEGLKNARKQEAEMRETIRNHESQARDARVYIAKLEAERVALRAHCCLRCATRWNFRWRR